MPSAEIRDVPINRAVVLRNETCAYCGRFLQPTIRTKDHVIGRRFVPKGKLDGVWNLLVDACKPSNNQKSDLEDDLSAISMQSDSWGRFGSPEPTLANEAVRKAKSKSRRTGKK